MPTLASSMTAKPLQPIRASSRIALEPQGGSVSNADTGGQMPRRRRGNRLELWEVALVKAMLETGKYNDQDILAYFTRPTRSINHRVIAEIRTGDKHRMARPATSEVLDEYLQAWPNVDDQTGLSVVGDELIIKAREAAISAIQTYNSASRYFRSETSIVLLIIAWTYLMHAILKREGVDYRYKDSDGAVKRTPTGQEKYWDLARCLRSGQSPLESAERKNIELLLGIRHEIEHRKTNRIDRFIAPYIQAAVINFNRHLTSEFGSQLSLSRDISTALQLSGFDAAQRDALKSEQELPRHIAALLDENIDSLSDEEAKDPRFSFRVAFVPKVTSKATKADELVEFVRPDSSEGEAIQKVLLKEVDKVRFTATEVITLVREAGFPKFNMPAHTELWRLLDAKNQGKGYGRPGDYRHTWVWYQVWVDKVIEHCTASGEQYR